MLFIENTPEQIAKHYSAALDSVGLIGALMSKLTRSVEDVRCLKANQEHLEIMLAKDFWTTEDLLPLHSAVEVVVS